MRIWSNAANVCSKAPAAISGFSTRARSSTLSRYEKPPTAPGWRSWSRGCTTSRPLSLVPESTISQRKESSVEHALNTCCLIAKLFGNLRRVRLNDRCFANRPCRIHRCVRDVCAKFTPAALHPRLNLGCDFERAPRMPANFAREPFQQRERLVSMTAWSPRGYGAQRS